MPNIIDSRDNSKVRELDSEIKNKFRWDWLDRTLSIRLGKGEPIPVVVGDFVKKVDVPGKAICTICDDLIFYGSRGWKALESHAHSVKHRKQAELKRTNYSLSSAFRLGTNATTSAASTSLTLPTTRQTDASCVKPVVPISDRKLHQQGLVLSTIANHSLPFTMAPVIFDVARELAKDPKALSGNTMDRTSASIKMRFGLAKTIHTRTITNMQNGHFSLNIDESTSNNLHRVLALLVSYYSPSLKEIIVEHLTSISVESVNAKSLYGEIVDIFSNHELPWQNLMSILMDSCAVMRGSKSGLETRIRSEKAPHLLDIDGDSCHHIHNAAKIFVKPFEFWVEQMFNDLHSEFKWSVDMKAVLVDICKLLGLKFTMPERFVPHRWLSMYDVAVSTNRLIDAYKVFFYSLLGKDKPLYTAHIVQIYHRRSISKESQAQIREIQKTIADKSRTDQGEKRKRRLLERLFFKSKKTKLIINFFVATLPLLKEYVCLFEMKMPLIHKLHDKQLELFKAFLACFMKAEIVREIKCDHDTSIIDESNNRVPKRDMFIGTVGSSIVKSAHQSDSVILSFLDTAETAYIMCAKYLSKKLPLNNKLLRCLSAIDPIAHGHSVTAKHLLHLPKLVTNVLQVNEKDAYELEVRKFQVDSNLPQIIPDLRIDHWWSDPHITSTYPTLFKMVKSLLTCFHGPQVEGSFSLMGEILDQKSGRMNIETLSAIQTVGYHLRASKKTPIDSFKRESVLHSDVDAAFIRNMRTSFGNYRMELAAKREKTNAQTGLALHDKQQTKRKAKEECDREQKKARMEHSKRQEELAQQRAKKKQRTDKLLALAKKLKLGKKK